MRIFVHAKRLRSAASARFGPCDLLLVPVFLLALCLLVPYQRTNSDSPVSYRSQACSFRPDFGPQLKRLFEEGELAGLSAGQDKAAFSYVVRPDQTTIRFPPQAAEATRRQLIIEPPDLAASDSAPLGVRFSGAFTPAEETKIRGAFGSAFAQYFPPEASESCAKAALVENSFESVVFELEHLRLFDVYLHVTMLCMAGVFFYLLAFAWRGRFERDDWPLGLLLALGAVTLFVCTRTAVGDHSLHLYNEANAYSPDRYGPAGPAFQKLLYRLFGIGIERLFFANQVLGLLATVPLYFFIRDRFGLRKAAFGAVLLLLTHPIWLRYSAGDLPYIVASFFFFCALALLVRPGIPSRKELLAAIFGLCLAMLTRPEYAVLPVAALLLVGGKRLLAIFRAYPRTSVYGVFGAALLLSPQYSLMLFAAPLEPGLVRFDLYAGLLSWFGIDRANCYLNLHWSPLTHIVATVAGFAVLLVSRWRDALALFACACLFLWNSVIFRDAYYVLHYQFPAFPFYIIAGGLGVGKLLELCSVERMGKGLAALVFGLLLLVALAPLRNYPALLQGNYTFMEEFRAFSERPLRMAATCTRVYDHLFDLVNADTVWFAQGSGQANISVLEALAIEDVRPATEPMGCYYYLRTPACMTDEKRQADCRHFEQHAELQPIWEDTIRPLSAFDDEHYLTDTLPIGIYKVTGYRR